MSAQVPSEPIDTQWLSDTLSRQRKAFLNQPYPDAAERRRRLLSLKHVLQTNQDALCDAIDRDFNGRARMETLSAEFLPSIMGITDAMKHLKGWMRAQRKLAPLVFQPAAAKVFPQPLGVIGIIVPWNYPLYLAVGPLIAALAAGNHAMIKMSEFTPAFGALFADLMKQTFDPSVVTVVNGEVEVAQAFSSLPFDHLLFTGSTSVGRHIMRAASEHLTPVTLELGGKSPAVIDRSMPVREAADRLVYPKCLNAGQTCVAPDYVLCPEDSVDAFVQHFINEARRQFGDVAENPDYSAIINKRQRDRLVGYLDDARDKGASIHIAGDSDNLDDYGDKLPPILVTNVKASMTLMQDEIFGPILPVMAYRHFDETLAYINAHPRPLALYVYGYEKQLRATFEQKTHSGALLFNEALIHVAMDSLPFGGVGASGMGQYHGRYGFNTFSKLKPVVSKQRLNSLKLIYPPYKGWLMTAILKLFGR
ncbi:coniferyl aldehyde dehydrogenase [Reinekea blandensis]|uniref:Aldehyde dehydrogenase n=1 Tax=Reinekea blandensis MED297 TaxID=314283 RepID=A4BAK6_9GAMM|nr:coniferyl aldehyde dehydrogenase [Reinekea blandensis]EAR10962.1 probable aldehyde dehydrogenase [Reinekea sp. MED297] [Reinekea blandensis MED297]